jgi:hypothetical protein
MLTPHNEQLCARAKEIYQSDPEVADQILDALRADHVVRLSFTGPGENDFTFSTAPRERLAARHPFIRIRPPTVAGVLHGFLMVSDATGASWMAIRGGLAPRGAA